jgi:hypothetical protein
VRGRAHTLLSDLKGRWTQQPFLLATAILKARIVPERITQDLDDPEIERRLLAALESSTADAIGWTPLR